MNRHVLGLFGVILSRFRRLLSQEWGYRLDTKRSTLALTSRGFTGRDYARRLSQEQGSHQMIIDSTWRKAVFTSDHVCCRIEVIPLGLVPDASGSPSDPTGLKWVLRCGWYGCLKELSLLHQQLTNVNIICARSQHRTFARTHTRVKCLG